MLLPKAQIFPFFKFPWDPQIQRVFQRQLPSSTLKVWYKVKERYKDSSKVTLLGRKPPIQLNLDQVHWYYSIPSLFFESYPKIVSRSQAELRLIEGYFWLKSCNFPSFFLCHWCGGLTWRKIGVKVWSVLSNKKHLLLMFIQYTLQDHWSNWMNPPPLRKRTWP